MTKKPRDRHQGEATTRMIQFSRTQVTIRVIGGVHHDRVAFVEAETVNQSQEREGVSVDSQKLSSSMRSQKRHGAAPSRGDAATVSSGVRIAASLRATHGPRLSSLRSLLPSNSQAGTTMGDEKSGHEQAWVMSAVEGMR